MSTPVVRAIGLRFQAICWGVLLQLTSVSGLCALLAAEPAVRHETPRWPYETRVGIFQVHSDYDVSRRQPLLGQLAHLHSELSEQLGIEIQQETVHLILFRHRQHYRHYMQLHFPEIPARQALFVRRRGPGMVFAYEHSQMETDLRHETTHALLNASLPYVPLWLDEGLAEYFEMPRGSRASGNPHQRLVQWQTMVRRVPDLQGLEQISELRQMGTGQYRDAWAWVHFLLHESEQSRRVLRGFLRELQAHSPPGSLARRIAAEIPDHQRRFLAHFGL